MSSVLDEHFSYLSLKHRSSLYSRAIRSQVRPGDVVVDLGCGVGVLGIEALAAGAAHVYGIDHSGAIDIAREAVSRLGLADRYTCIADSTFRVALPEQVDVILCDHVGYFGFDYGIIAMMEDARRRMLKPGGRVIPQALGLHLAGLSSDRLRREADQWLYDPVPECFRWLHDMRVNSKIAVLVEAGEVLTAPATLGHIDLTRDNPESFSFTASLTATRDARFDGLGGWFDCELAPGVRMTNSPLEDGAIERYRAFLPVAEPFMVKAGESVAVTLTIRHERSMIAWTVTPPGGGKRQKMSTWASQILAPSDTETQSTGPVVLNRLGEARRQLLALVDGRRSEQDIIDALQAEAPNLFPSQAELLRFIRREVASITR